MSEDPEITEAHIKEHLDAAVVIHYTNHEYRTGRRVIIPDGIWFGESQWHQGKQWFLKAFDMEKLAWRDFALRDILGWTDNPPVQGGMQ